MGTQESYDVIVVGGGTAGCIVASRLSEDPACSVLLLEAGGDGSALGAGRGLGDSGLGAEWGLAAGVHADRAMPYTQAKVLGGGSRINSAVATRGLPSDFDRWEALAGPDWGWEAVLPRYVALEHDHDFAGPWHGSTGPVPIRRTPREQLVPVQEAFLGGCLAAGHPYADDLNLPDAVGAGVWPRNLDASYRRVSTADTHLRHAAGRPNLTVRLGCTVVELTLDEALAVGGVVVEEGGTTTAVAGRRVVLAAGAVATPRLLQASGIGSPTGPDRRGNDARVRSEGVGRGLEEHPLVGIPVVPTPGTLDGLFERQVQVGLRYASAAGDPADMVMLLTLPVELEAGAARASGARRIMRLGVGLMVAESRGQVGPATGESSGIALNLLDRPTDLTRLRLGLRRAHSLLREGPLAAFVERIPLFPEHQVDDDAALDAYVRHHVMTFRHPSGTVAMGTSVQAPADPCGRVRGVEGLYVADASAMPATVAAPVNLTVMMLAERVAGHVHDQL